MSYTPEADALKKFSSEGLNDAALIDLANMALAGLKVSMPEHFDENGEPYKNRPTVLATQHEPYFKDVPPEV